MVKDVLMRRQDDQSSPIRLMDKFVLSDRLLQLCRSWVLDKTALQVKHQWNAMTDHLDAEIRFQITDEDPPEIGDVQSTVPLMVRREAQKLFTKEAESQFWDDVSKLELENEHEFSNFWTDRVLTKVAVYSDGLAVVDDVKLQSQLSELLCNYLLKELIPDSLNRAQAQGLSRSRKTKKNIKKLESVLKQGPVDHVSLVSAVKKFNKKQDIPDLDEAAISESMNAQVSDMTRKMHKQSNGPLLFLPLIIALLAKRQQKLVYATGKFAPKLMKQLKSCVPPEEYERLEKWKDLAKAGTLTSEDKETMRSMASRE
jgi:hypothetical protein